MVKFLLLAKIIVLTAALIFVLWAIRSVDSNSVSRALAALGVEPGTGSATLHASSSNGQPGSHRLNLCKTRVKALVWSDGKKVEERVQGLKMTWMAHDPAPREISYLDMEKWLGQHCQIEVVSPSQQDEERSAFVDELVVKYIDGSDLEIRRAGQPGGQEDLFRIGDQLVRSPDLVQALVELRKIAQLSGSSSGPKAP